MVARAAFPKGNTYMRMRDELGPVFADEQFIELYPDRGQPAESPARLALVTVMQFAEGLSDRQAADAVRARIGPKGSRLLPEGISDRDHTCSFQSTSIPNCKKSPPQGMYFFLIKISLFQSAVF